MWLALRGKLLIGALVALSLPLVGWIVYLGEGTASSSVHLFYIPIITAAFFLGGVGGLLTAVAASIVCYVIPQDVRFGIMQPLGEHVVRALFFYAIAILTARLSAILQHRSAELANLLSVSRAMGESLRSDRLFSTIAESAARMVKAKGSSLLLLDRERNELIPRAHWGLEDDDWSQLPLRLEDTQGDEAMLEGKVLSVLAGAANGAQHDEGNGRGVISMLWVPMMKGREPLGVIRVYADRRRRFSRRDYRLLSAFAAQAAVAMDNAQLYENVRRSYWDTVRALARAIEAKDPYTLGHSERVTELSVRLGQAVGLAREQLDIIRFGAILHDVGKIGVAEHVLAKPDELSAQDEMIVRLHPLIGKSIVEPVEFLRDTLPIILQHHERYDGSGYPGGTAGEEIDYLARVVAVANAFDNLTSERPDHVALAPDEALQEIEFGAGTLFDPQLAAAFVEMMRPLSQQWSAEGGRISLPDLSPYRDRRDL